MPHIVPPKCIYRCNCLIRFLHKYAANWYRLAGKAKRNRYITICLSGWKAAEEYSIKWLVEIFQRASADLSIFPAAAG
jgi:hypothetical protein